MKDKRRVGELPSQPLMVGAPKYHDYRQGRTNEADCCLTKRPPVAPPPVGAGKGFKGIR